jgi:hypothetical protein
MSGRTAGVVLALAAIWSLGLGYGTFGKFYTNKIQIRASKVSFPAGNPFCSSLEAAADHFNDNPSQQWFIQEFNDGVVGVGNRQNEVWFSSDPDVGPATTFTWQAWPSNMIIEADVVFYSGEAYTASMKRGQIWPYGGSSRPFETTAIHYYGVAAGLTAEDAEYNVMGQDWTHVHANGDLCTSYVGEDAGSGLVALYGLASDPLEDVGATLFKWVGSSGGYSRHGFCRMRAERGGVLSATPFDGQFRYAVARGQRVQVEFTYENNGASEQTVRVGFYLSTNNSISTADRLIRNVTMTLRRDNVRTAFTTVVIPPDLRPGRTYYLGVIVDDDDILQETSEQNAAYHIILVKKPLLSASRRVSGAAPGLE